MSWTSVTSHRTEVWDYIALYESYDYVANLYKVFHNTSAEPAKLREINARRSRKADCISKTPSRPVPSSSLCCSTMV